MNPTIPIVLLMCGITLLIAGTVFYVTTQDKITWYVRRQQLNACPYGVESNWVYFGDHQEVNPDNIPFADISGSYHMVYIWNITNPTETFNGGKPSVHLMGPYTFDRFGGTIRTYFRNFGQEYGSSAYTHQSRFIPERSARDPTTDYVTALDYEYNRQVHMLTERGAVNGPAGEWFTGDFIVYAVESDWYIQSYAWHLPAIISATINELATAIEATNGGDHDAAITTIVNGWASDLTNANGIPDYFRISTGTPSGIPEAAARTLLLGSSGVGLQNPNGDVWYFCSTNTADCSTDVAADVSITEAQALQVWTWLSTLYYPQIVEPALLTQFGPEGLTDVLDIPFFHFVSNSYGGGKSVADYDTVWWPYGAPEFGHVVALDPLPAGVTFGIEEAYVMLSWTAYNLGGWENMAFATHDYYVLGYTPGNPDRGFTPFTNEQTDYFLDHYINGPNGVWNKGISYLFAYNDGSGRMDPAMVNLGDPIIQTILVYDYCSLWHSPWYDRIWEFHPNFYESTGVIGYWWNDTLASTELEGRSLGWINTGRYDDTKCFTPVIDTSENSPDYVWGDKLPEGHVESWLGMNQINDHQEIPIYNDIWARPIPFVYDKDVKHFGHRTFARYKLGWNVGNMAKGVEPYTNPYDGIYDVSGPGVLFSRAYLSPCYFIGSDPAVTTDLINLSPPAPTNGEFDWYYDYDEHSGIAIKQHNCYQHNHRIEDEYYNFFERNITKDAFIPMHFKRIVIDWTDPATAYWINEEFNQYVYDPQANALNSVIVTSVFGSIFTIAGIVCAILMCIKR